MKEKIIEILKHQVSINSTKSCVQIADEIIELIQSSLPSDKEIEEAASDKKNGQNPYMFKQGARWMKEQITSKLK
jgi:predicted RNA-binding protein with PIN domain